MITDIQYRLRTVIADNNIAKQDPYVTLGERGTECLDAPCCFPSGGTAKAGTTPDAPPVVYTPVIWRD